MSETPKRRDLCAAGVLHQKNINKHGERYRKNRQEDETYVLNYVGSSARQITRANVMTIPVVVHVVYNKNKPIENISDEQIYNQIERLNKDYRRLNEDIISVPDVWKSLAADSRIEFKLACVDPDGNKTNAITRTATKEEFFDIDDDPSTPEKIKFTSEGGRDAWDSTRYLNIWVCNLVRGLLGYAQFPRGDPQTDGVVISHWTFGENGSALSPENPFGTAFNMGRTATHEVGHYLDCYHVWGDEMMFEDPCSLNDNVADTPNQKGDNGGVPTFPDFTEACPDTGPNGTMFMNYMDYTDDVGMNMFTLGQVVRMHATLSGPRASLLESAVVCYAEEARVTEAMQLPSKVYDGVNKIVSIVDKLSYV
jgi:Pregnancy-associated plasma protein-A